MPEAMSGSVGEEGKSLLRSVGRRAIQTTAFCLVGVTIFLSTIISVELWRERHEKRRRRPQLPVNKPAKWAMSFRNFFS